MKTTLFPLIRHALTVGAGYLIGKGWFDTENADQIIAGIMAVVAVGWSRFEKRSTPSQPVAAPVALIATLAASLFLVGCTHMKNANSYAMAAEIIAKDTTFLALKKHPEWQEHFVTARGELAVIAASPAIDVRTIAEIIARVPVEVFESDEARLLIGDAGIILQHLAPNKGTIVSEEKLNNVREVVHALIRGIDAGIRIRGL